MATSLTVTLQESLVYPNGNKEVITNTTQVTGINQILKRLDTISYYNSGSGIEILRFVDSEAEQTAGSFVRDEVKYIRITNLDKTNFVEIFLIEEDGFNGESVSFKIYPGRSMMFSDADFDASEAGDYVYEGIWDQDYYSLPSKISVMKAKADTANVQIEYLVASA